MPDQIPTKLARHIARDISYASSAKSRSGRAMIRILEGATGRNRLIRKAAGYEQEVANGQDFWAVMKRRYGISVKHCGPAYDLPKEGPLVVVSNHPYGILDGLVMGAFLSETRGDFRILANSVFNKAPDINRIILPISFDDSREAVQQNITTRKSALRYLAEGGAIGVFPGGTVSTSAKAFSMPLDPSWRNFTAKMIQKSGAQVVPIYFHGANSRLFQLASHLHETLRLGLLIKEFGARVNSEVALSIGAPIAPKTLARFGGESSAMMDYLRAATYALSPNPVSPLEYGYEFEEKYRA
ncbi:lysophospholipid acyltransferase family protein [Halocynthiibacter sp. C4]|uniref:lysophospholipid acyltransferase family protein n=1 Tax=Halocynthiibacter sp. C4 TaxID=2992758 RepID=UPI00237A2184|nr:lysophospholipid acyltransferase family protein [Halocynthiibacter sp. C4]MDE0589808.1 lysophospholipid acyltransferase family protein [Halocynthiibacter sp. C4]